MLFMGKSFRADDLNQALLLPPSLHDWLPETHLARFLVDVVAALDLGSIYASYESKDGRGQSAYAPETMLRVLLYGYATGVYSSRKLEARTYEDVAFRYLSADTHPGGMEAGVSDRQLAEAVPLRMDPASRLRGAAEAFSAPNRPLNRKSHPHQIAARSRCLLRSAAPAPPAPSTLLDLAR
jgi:hypothetical protein